MVCEHQYSGNFLEMLFDDSHLADEGEPDSSTEDAGNDTTGAAGTTIRDTYVPMSPMAPSLPAVSICENVTQNVPTTAGNGQTAARMSFLPFTLLSYEAMDFLSPERMVDILMEQPDFDFATRARELVGRGVLDNHTAATALEDVHKCRRHMQRFASNLIVKHCRQEIESNQPDAATKELFTCLCATADPRY